MLLTFLNQYTEICVGVYMMMLNFKLRNVAMMILSLLFSIEVGDKIGLKIVIIISGICYIAILEIKKLYRAGNLIKEKAERKH